MSSKELRSDSTASIKERIKDLEVRQVHRNCLII